MTTTDLSLVPAGDLIAELMRRTTFLGVVIQATQDYKGKWPAEQDFRVHFNDNLDLDKTSGLLDAVSRYIDLHHC